MKIKVRLISIIVVASIFTLMFAGCGNSTSNTSDNSTAAVQGSSADQTLAQENTKSSEPVTLVYTIWGGETDKQNGVKLLEKVFTPQHPNVKVDIQVYPYGDYDTKITAMVAANDAPDVSTLESMTIAYPLAEQGKLTNLKTFLGSNSELKVDDMVPAGLYYSDPNTLIGIGPGVESVGMFYNIELFKKAGITNIPTDPKKAWSWQEFVDIAKKLTIDTNGKNASETGFDAKNIVQYGFNCALDVNHWGNMLYENGGEYVTKEGKFGLTAPEATEVLQNFADLINVHHVMPTTVMAKSLPSLDVSMSTGKIALFMEGQWLNYSCSQTMKDGIWGVVCMPKMKDNYKTVVMTGILSIFASSKHQNEAWDLEKTLISPDSNLDTIQSGGIMPLIKSWYTQPDLIAKWTENKNSHPEGYEGVFIDGTLNYSRPVPQQYIKNFNNIKNVVDPALDQVWLGKKTAEQAMKEIEAQAQSLIQGRRDVQ